MKRFALLLFTGLYLALAGCFEITNENTVNDDGSGVYSYSTDLGSIFDVINMMGGKEAQELGNTVIDTSFSLAIFKDSISDLTDADKALLDRSASRMIIDGKKEILIHTFTFNYNEFSELLSIHKLIQKIRAKSVSAALGSVLSKTGSEEDISALGAEGEDSLYPDDCFDYMNQDGKISKKINAENMAKAATDKGLQSLKELGQMGAPMTMKNIINLPRPAKNVTGKYVRLSDDKMKVTIESSIDDFFENPSSLEYEIEY